MTNAPHSAAAPSAPSPARPASGSRIKAAKPSSEVELHSVDPAPSFVPPTASEMPRVVGALLTLVATWRPRLTEPSPLALLRGVEALLGAVRDQADAPGLELVPVATGPVVGLRVGEPPKGLVPVPDHELRLVMSEHVLQAVEEVAELEEYVGTIEVEATGTPIDPAEYLTELRSQTRGLRMTLAEASAALTGHAYTCSVATHARLLARIVDRKGAL